MESSEKNWEKVLPLEIYQYISFFHIVFSLNVAF